MKSCRRHFDQYFVKTFVEKYKVLEILQKFNFYRCREPANSKIDKF